MLVAVVLVLVVVEGAEELPQLAVAEVVCSSSGCSYGVSSSKTAAGAPIPCLLDVPWHYESEDFGEAPERTTHEDRL